MKNKHFAEQSYVSKSIPYFDDNHLTICEQKRKMLEYTARMNEDVEEIKIEEPVFRKIGRESLKKKEHGIMYKNGKAYVDVTIIKTMSLAAARRYVREVAKKRIHGD